jgi:hypothetical protein
MKTRTRQPAPDPERLRALRAREMRIACVPTAESYLKLADDYQALGLAKESDRIRQLAELFESGSDHQQLNNNNGLLFGAVNPVMLFEVLQILSRSSLTGILSIETQAQTFHLFFDQGHIINATSQQYVAGMESFRMALRAASGNYRFVEKSVEGIERLIHDQTEILLLNAAHDADEEAEHNSKA